MKSAHDHIRIPRRAALTMIVNYVRNRVAAQIRAVSFIILYLVGFQILIFGTAPAHALVVSLGVGMVVLGLTCFLEGVFLGLMPLGEKVGIKLPHRGGILAITFFGLLLGFGSTYAEPALASLRAAGASVTAWQTPLLFHLLNQGAELLLLAIAAGVGVAIAFGMIRFTFGLSIKPFVYLLIPLLLGLSAYCALDENLSSILGLAWDAGAVTTGAVTVPLVLALGIGVSRASGKQEDDAGGFGIIMLASAFPVAGVLLLGLTLHPTFPQPVSEQEFFDPSFRTEALKLFENEAALARHAFQTGSQNARTAFFRDNPQEYEAALQALEDPDSRRRLLGNMPLSHWRAHRASPTEHERLPRPAPKTPAPIRESTPLPDVFARESISALRAVLPLTLLLLVVLLGVLRERPRYADEVGLGILLAVGGMALFTSGVHLGLAPLGDSVGRSLPRAFRSVPREEGRLIIEPFDENKLFNAVTPEGETSPFFYLLDADGTPKPISYHPEHFDPETRKYEHIIKSPPLFGPQLTLAGIGLVFLFAFGLGFGSTLAEPALKALGLTVEDLSVGTIKSSGVVRAVSLGVGFGLMAGVGRLLYDIPILWLLLPPYLLLLPLTFWSEEDFAGIAWDCGGVTTGGITVPLVLAMGLGIGGELNVSDGFGILAMASVYPILTTLLYGLLKREQQRRRFQLANTESPDES